MGDKLLTSKIKTSENNWFVLNFYLIFLTCLCKNGGCAIYRNQRYWLSYVLLCRIDAFNSQIGSTELYV